MFIGGKNWCLKLQLNVAKCLDNSSNHCFSSGLSISTQPLLQPVISSQKSYGRPTSTMDISLGWNIPKPHHCNCTMEIFLLKIIHFCNTNCNKLEGFAIISPLELTDVKAFMHIVDHYPVVKTVSVNTQDSCVIQIELFLRVKQNKAMKL